MATARPIELESSGVISHRSISADAVREQLKRILNSPSFQHSKRYPRFLQFVVEQALNGDSEKLKERVIGNVVFDRAPNYDPQIDPIVRVAAGEIRKRLAQYYVQPGCESELRIHLPAGAYVPEFYWPEMEALEVAPRPETQSEISDKANENAISVGIRKRVIKPLYIAIAASILAITGTVVGVSLLRERPVDRFWHPFLQSNVTPLVCLADAGEYVKNQANPEDGPLRGLLDQHELLALSDVVVLNHITPSLGHEGSRLRIQNSSNVSFADLRQGPAILIGGRDNRWSVRAMQQLRYQIFPIQISPFEKNAELNIRDVKQSKDLWHADNRPSGSSTGKTYGLIARFRDPTTGQNTILIAGIGTNGTLAAAEFIGSSELMETFAKSAPRDWDTKNLEIVVESEIINQDHGAPHVVATYYW